MARRNRFRQRAQDASQVAGRTSDPSTTDNQRKTTSVSVLNRQGATTESEVATKNGIPARNGVPPKHEGLGKDGVPRTSEALAKIGPVAKNGEPLKINGHAKGEVTADDDSAAEDPAATYVELIGFLAGCAREIRDGVTLWRMASAKQQEDATKDIIKSKKTGNGACTNIQSQSPNSTFDRFFAELLAVADADGNRPEDLDFAVVADIVAEYAYSRIVAMNGVFKAAKLAAEMCSSSRGRSLWEELERKTVSRKRWRSKDVMKVSRMLKVF